MPMSGLQYVSKWKKILQKTIRTHAITECEINILPDPSLFVPFYHSWFAIPMIDHHFWQVLLIHHLTEYMICMQRSSSAVAINFYSLDIVCTPLSVVGVGPPTRASKRGVFLDRISTLRGGCWKSGGNYFQGGYNFI